VRLEQMRRFVREHAIDFLEHQAQGPGGALSDDAAMELAIEAQRTAHRRLREAKPRPRRSRKKS
jgi:hypothetical protein